MARADSGNLGDTFITFSDLLHKHARVASTTSAGDLHLSQDKTLGCTVQDREIQFVAQQTLACVVQRAAELNGQQLVFLNECETSAMQSTTLGCRPSSASRQK